MKNAKLIKKEQLIVSSPTPKPAAPQGTSLNRAVKVVKDWVKDRHTMQQQHAWQMFQIGRFAHAGKKPHAAAGFAFLAQ